jgi:predicted transcriptional regulator YdeE
MNLTTQAQIVQVPETHYVCIEKIGPFMETAPAAWNKLHELVLALAENNQITGYLSLYKVPEKLYCAGVSLSAAPKNLPSEMKYMLFKGGKYSKFVLTGPYSDLPAACGVVFGMVDDGKIQMRNDYCLENYTTDPKVTPDDKNVTEILIPTV